jgi:hypothetical protein
VEVATLPNDDGHGFAAAQSGLLRLGFERYQPWYDANVRQ